MTVGGLNDQVLEILRRICAKYPAIRQVKLYGSRAKGNYRENSDIDLVAIGEIDRFYIANILLDLDETDIPYLVDLQSYSELKNRQLIEHIDRVGLVIYERDQVGVENNVRWADDSKPID